MTDTIAAVATAHGIGSISIIRLSGELSLAIASTLSQKQDFKNRHATLTPLYNLNNELIDEAIVIYFKGPHSFTAEDIVNHFLPKIDGVESEINNNVANGRISVIQNKAEQSFASSIYEAITEGFEIVDVLA